MSRERYVISYGQASARAPGPRALYWLLILAALALLVLARMQHPLLGTAREILLERVATLVEWSTRPVSALRGIFTLRQDWIDAAQENARLREENDLLRHWQSVAQALKAENDALRSLAAYQPVKAERYVTGRVIGQSPSGYSASILLDTGQAEGVRTFQPVIDAYGLIGRVIETAEHSSRVLLLSDPSSRVPIVTVNGRHRAIAVGSGASDELLQLTFLSGEPQQYEIAEPVVTTEQGELIPGGIAIGTVFRREKGTVFVKPMRPLAQAEYVRVIVSK